MPTNRYIDRYVAFVDVLGFRELIAELNSGAITPDDIRRVLTTIYNPARFSYSIDDVDFRANSISDAVVVSTKFTRGGLIYLIDALTELTLKLLKRGYLVRGAVVRERLIHDETIVFGQALVDAHLLESSRAIFPRIVVREEVRRDFLEHASRREQYWLHEVSDGQYFINVLHHMDNYGRDLEHAVHPDRFIPHQISYYFDIRKAIDLQLTRTRNEPRKFEKIRWFAQYWNEMAYPEIPGLEPLEIPV
jgi:hypothetical protein